MECKTKQEKAEAREMMKEDAELQNNDADRSSAHNGSGTGMSPGVLMPPGVQDLSTDLFAAHQPS